MFWSLPASRLVPASLLPAGHNYNVMARACQRENGSLRRALSSDPPRKSLGKDQVIRQPKKLPKLRVMFDLKIGHDRNPRVPGQPCGPNHTGHAHVVDEEHAGRPNQSGGHVNTCSQHMVQIEEDVARAET